MALTETSGYTRDQLWNALHSASRDVKFKYEILDSTNRYLRTASSISTGQIENNSSTELKRVMKFSCHDEDEIDWLSERVRPAMMVRMFDGGWAQWPLGVYLVASPERQVETYGVRRDVEAYDQLLVLTDDVLDRYAVFQGTPYTEAARLLLSDTQGIGAVDIEFDGTVLPADREWEPGTSKLEVVNDLMAAINFEPIFFDRTGSGVLRRKLDPVDRPIDYVYRADQYSVLSGSVTDRLDLFDVPNRFIGYVSEADRPALYSEYTNDDSASPTSTVSRGRVITEVIGNMEAADQIQLDSAVMFYARARARVYRETKISTALMPFHDESDVIQLDYDAVGPLGLYLETAWTMPLNAGALMEHQLQKVVQT